MIAPMWFFTDPDRTPDALSVVKRLPAGSGVVFRGFGRSGTRDQALRLSEVTRRRGLSFLIGQDAELAAAVGADGVHLPERKLQDAWFLRRDHPAWLITGAAHDIRALRRAENAGCDAVFISAVFASQSASAGLPKGPFRMDALARCASQPVFALGGVRASTARRLIGVSGFAAIDAFLEGQDDR